MCSGRIRLYTPLPPAADTDYADAIISPIAWQMLLRGQSDQLNNSTEDQVATSPRPEQPLISQPALLASC